LISALAQLEYRTRELACYMEANRGIDDPLCKTTSRRETDLDGDGGANGESDFGSLAYANDKRCGGCREAFICSLGFDALPSMET